MADELASLTLQVSGDISPVEDALNELPAVAQTAAQNIDAALASIGDEGSAATAGISQLSDALSGMWAGDWAGEAQQFDSALQGVGDAAGGAVPPVHELGDAAGHAAEGAHEAGSAFSELAEGFIGVLEKLGLMVGAFEALRESMIAAAREQAFLVSMEALTHSAEAAESALSMVDQTALRLPVAFDSLLSATQKFQAFGVALEDIPNLLNAAADAAAATGNAFDSVAAGLERVQVTGQVMARSLVQMGITWQQVATQMGVSVEQAQAAFKKGAQSAEEDTRILVATIEANYAGLSERLAGTLGGAWQAFKNQLTELADSIGAVLGPLAGSILVVFRDVAAVLTDFFGAIRQGLEWLGSTGTAILGAFVTAVAGIGIAFNLISGPVGVALSVISLLLEAFSAWSASAEDAAAKEERLAEERRIASADIKAEEVATANLSAALARHGIIVDQAGESIAGFTARLQAIWDEFAKTKDMVERAALYWSLYKGVLSDIYPTFEAFQAAMQKQLKALQDQAHDDSVAAIHKRMLELKDAVTNAQEAYDLMRESEQKGLASHGQTLDALNKLHQAQDAFAGKTESASAALRREKAAIDDDTAGVKEYLKAVQLISDSLGKVSLDVAKLGTGTQDFAAHIQDAKGPTDEVAKAFLEIQANIDKARINYDAMNTDQKFALDYAQGLLNATMEEAAELAVADDVAKFFAGHLQSAAEIAKTTGDVMKQIWNDVLQPERDAEAEQERINQGLQMLGVNSRRAGEEFQKAFDAFKALSQDGRRGLDEINNAAEHLATTVARTVEQQQKVLALLTLQNAPVKIQLDAQLKLLEMKQKEVQYTDMTGESELRLQQQIEGVRLKLWEVHQLTMGMADTFAKVTNDLAQAWNNVGASISQALFSGQNFGQAMMNMVKQLAEKITGDLIQGALNDLAAHLLKDSGLMENFGGVVTKVTKNISSNFDDCAVTIKGFGETTQATMARAQASVTTAGSSMIATFDLIATAIGAIASIFSAIELAHTNTLLTRIEESTRRMDITMEGVIVASLQHLPDYLQAADNSLSEMVGNTANMVDLLISIATDIHGMNAVLMAGGFGAGGGGTQGMSAQIADALASMNVMIDSLQRQIGTSGGGGTQPSYVILGGGGGGGSTYSLPSASLTLPTGSTGVYIAPDLSSGLMPSGGGVTINAPITIQAGVVAGVGGMQQLANMVGAQVVQTFRGVAGLKI
jgi:hypothetical protein